LAGVLILAAGALWFLVQSNVRAEAPCRAVGRPDPMKASPRFWSPTGAMVCRKGWGCGVPGEVAADLGGSDHRPGVTGRVNPIAILLKIRRWAGRRTSDTGQTVNDRHRPLADVSWPSARDWSRPIADVAGRT